MSCASVEDIMAVALLVKPGKIATTQTTHPLRPTNTLPTAHLFGPMRDAPTHKVLVRLHETLSPPLRRCCCAASGLLLHRQLTHCPVQVPGEQVVRVPALLQLLRKGEHVLSCLLACCLEPGTKISWAAVVQDCAAQQLPQLPDVSWQHLQAATSQRQACANCCQLT